MVSRADALRVPPSVVHGKQVLDRVSNPLAIAARYAGHE